MSTKNLKDPVFIKEATTVETEKGIMEVPERRVKYRDDRLLKSELERVKNTLDLDDMEYKRLEVINDPATWARVYLVNPEKNTEPLSLRFYQEDILRTPSRFKILRLGRQMGKCVHGDTYISLPNGQSLRAKELYHRHKDGREFEIVGYDQETKELVPAIGIIEDNGEAESVMIETRKGYIGTFTFGHKMSVLRTGVLCEIPAIEVDIGDHIPVIKSEEKFHRNLVDDEFAGLTALDMAIVGILTFTGIKQYDTTIEYRRDNNYIKEILDEYLEQTESAKIYTTTKSKTVSYRLVYTDGSNRILRFMEKYDMLPYDKTASPLPDFVLRLPPDLAHGFLRGVFSCRTFFRGSVKEKYALTCEIVHDAYSHQIVLLMRKLGYDAYRKHKYGFKNSVKSDAIYVHIKNKQHILDFMDNAGQFMESERWQECISTVRNCVDADPQTTENNQDIEYDEVLKMTYIPPARTYNIAVKDYHMFVAGGIITHNSVTMAVDMLWRAANRSNYKIVLVCPYLAQVTMIFSRMKALISGASPLKQILARDRANPPTLEFTNGSTIKGFVAGDSVTGQSANALYYDESDYIDDSDKERINPVVFNFPDHIIVEASTPTGKRGEFYRTCVDENNYVEFHYASIISPNWTDDMDYAYRATHTEAAYEHEVMAEFGSPEAGVFKGDHIDASIEMSKFKEDLDNRGNVIKRSYTYKEFLDLTTEATPEKRARFFIGVDWNAADNGTQISVIGYSEKLYIANIVSIHAREFTQTKAVETIVELNDVYDPEAIYVDVGFGGLQIETLHLYGKKHPDTKLHKRVVGIDFANKIEIPDVATGKTTKKRLKQFMIDRFQRLLENGQLIIPSYENNEGGLAEEMRNFEIARYGIYGEPIYGKNTPDHKIMATALAIFAYSRIVEHLDQFPFRPGLGHIARDLSRRIRLNTLVAGKYERSKIEKQQTQDYNKSNGSKTIAQLTGLSIPYGGIIGSDGKFPKERTNYPQNSTASRRSFKGNRGGRSRF